MHIGFLTTEYPHKLTGGSGGIGTSIFALARGLCKKGARVTVFVCSQLKDDVFIDDGIEVRSIRNVKLRGLSWLLTRWKIQRIINGYVRAKDLSILESPDWGGLTAFMKLRCPVVIRCNGSDTYFCSLDGRKVKWRNEFLEGKALRSAHGIISVSGFTAGLTSRLFQIPRRKFTVIPNSILIDRFPMSMDFSRNRILYFGTIIRKKGVLELPEIFNEVINIMPEATLTLAGRDAVDVLTGQSTWDMMKKLFSPQALSKVVYLGAKPHSEIAEEIHLAHVCVFPSFSEAFPVSWLEAMVCGKAIVASHMGWSPECIENGEEGFLADPKDHGDFARKIIELLVDLPKANVFGLNARRRVIRDFSSEVIAEKSLTYYREHVAG